MVKNKFILSTLILLIGGFITKILGMIIKIIMTRMIGTKGISLYMLIMPTFNLFIVLAQMGFPIAISKIVSEDKTENKKLIISSMYLSIFISIILMISIIFLDKTICKFLHNTDLYYPILAIGFTLPFISISCIIRGYFFGKEKMWPHVISNFTEQIVRIILYIIVLPMLKKYNVIISVSFIILSNIVSELTSILILYFFLPKNIRITSKMLHPDAEIIKDVLNISIPNTGSRIIGTIGYFFEPIILTTMLLFTGYSQKYITYEYGIITGYVFPLLLLPSFFSMAISQATLPVVTKAYANKNIKYVKSKIKQSILFSFFIGLFFTIIYMIFPSYIMKFIYNTTEGVKYLKIITPFFLFQYIQSPLVSIMQAMDKSKDAFKSTIIGTIIKISLIIVLSLLNFGIYSLIVALIVNMIYVTIFNYIKIKRAIN